MEIGRITEVDLPALAILYQQLQPNEPSVAKMQEALKVIQHNLNQVMLGAKINGQLIGSVLGIACPMLFGQCKSFLVVEDVVVDANHRRMGVGTALMRAIERYAVERHCSYIMLITDTDREGAQRFYAALGYQTEPYKGFKKAI